MGVLVTYRGRGVGAINSYKKVSENGEMEFWVMILFLQRMEIISKSYKLYCCHNRLNLDISKSQNALAFVMSSNV